jgi:O-antigen/teichoic acid export membrane protein
VRHRIPYSGRQLLSWFKDEAFRRLVKNAGWLLGSTGIASVLQLLTAVIAARSLGPSRYGTLILVLLYAEIVVKLVSFQGWQATVKFGSDALVAKDQYGLRQLLKFGFTLEAAAAAVGTALAISVSGPVTKLLGWDASIVSQVRLYSLIVLFNLSGTPIGILRLFDRFDLLGYIGVFNAAIRLLGVGLCALSKQKLMVFVWIYLLTGIAAQVAFVVASLWILNKHSMLGFLTASLRGVRHRFSGLWDYVWATNLQSSVFLVSRDLDLVLISALATPASVGIYKIAKQFARALPMAFDPLYHAIYPELSRFWALRERELFVSLMKRSTLMVGVGAAIGWLGYLIVGEQLIHLAVGEAFTDAYLISVIYMFAMVIALVTFTFQPAVLALGRPRASIVAQLVSTGVYLVFLFAFTPAAGLVGASIAFVLYYVIWSAIMWFYLKPHLILTPEGS